MAQNDKASASKPTEMRFRNISKVDQTFQRADGSSVRVPRDDTVILPIAFGEKFMNLLEPVLDSPVPATSAATPAATA